MVREVGFYEPAEEVGDVPAEVSTDEDYIRLFAYISEKTGWTPRQIGQLTIKQIKLYLDGWTKKREGPADLDNPDYEEVRQFNLNAGIERINKTK